MRNPAALALILLLATVTEVRFARADDETLPPLRFNPFERPAFDAEAGHERDAAATRSSEWSPVLRATLVAGDTSLANLGGVVLQLGEETHGYRLVEVREWEAVFDYQGERLELSVAASKGGTP